MKKFFLPFLIVSAMSCQSDNKKNDKAIHLITLDPGHFHAALVQKTMYADVDSVAHVYAPEGNDLRLHLSRIDAFNTRSENPTHWKEEVYTGNDFFEKMLAEKKARPNGEAGRRNVVVLAGNNQKKTEYILKSLETGFNVLADKPMAINSAGFEKLKNAFEKAKQKNLLLYDIMTERFEINTILQRELSMIPEIFGELEKGTPENPGITKESIHHFYKYVSGSVLTRPAWFIDVLQQGEGIVDVMTHLVDLVQWECFPEQTIDYTKDIQINSAKRWATNLSHEDFVTITKWNDPSGKYYPSYLDNYVRKDASLDVFNNGEINYTLRSVHAKTSVIWRYKAPEGTGDTHYSVMRGSKANLVIRQGAEEQYKPALYIEPVTKDTDYEKVINEKIKSVLEKYPGVELKKIKQGWQIIIPEKYKEGHEAHFGRVMEKFLSYLKNKNMPAWEVPNMLAKYYTTTKALEIALKNN